MRHLVPLIMVAAASSMATLAVQGDPPEPPPSANSQEVDRAYELLAREQAAHDQTRRVAEVRGYGWAIWRERCRMMGTPQDWGGPVVSTPRLPGEDQPERIPAPAVPYPTVPEGK